VVSDPTDFKGLPWIVNGKAEFIAYAELEELVNAEVLTVVLIDDLGQAAPAVQAALMQLLLARKINGHKISDNVVFIAATNRKEDMAAVTGILGPVKSRFFSILELDYNTEDWCKWAYKNGMPNELISFVQFDKKAIETAKETKDMVNIPNSRTIAHVGEMENKGLPQEVWFDMVAGAFGEAEAAKYQAFKKVYAYLPTVDEIIQNPMGVRVPLNISEQYALMGNITLRMNKTTIDPLTMYLNRMEVEIMAACMKNASVASPEIISTGAFAQWGIKNAQYVM
jgi:hypothetical protein